MSETQESRGSSPIVRVAIASWIGTSIEWYDFFLYATAAALVLGPLFFSPKLSPLAAQLSALIVDLQCRFIILPKCRLSDYWLEDPFPAEYCARRCRSIDPVENRRNT